MAKIKTFRFSILPIELLLFFLIMLILTSLSYCWEKTQTPNVLLSYAFYGSVGAKDEYAYFLPESAIFTHEDKPCVYVAEIQKTIYREEQRAQRIWVVIEKNSDKFVAISGNIMPDMQFVSSTDKILSDGALIRSIE